MAARALLELGRDAVRTVDDAVALPARLTEEVVREMAAVRQGA